MPIYDYTCSSCGTLTEVVHGIHDPAPRFCPACGAEGTLTKAFALPAVHFKGSGWAKKDRASAARRSSKPAADAGSGGPAESPAGGDGTAAESGSGGESSATGTPAGGSSGAPSGGTPD